MADMLRAISNTQTNEAGYNRATKGSGETYRGIDRAKGGTAAKVWKGWLIIDDFKKRFGVPAENAIIKNDTLDGLVNGFYTDFLKVAGLDQINNQQLLDFMVDFYFHKPAWLILSANLLVKKYGVPRSFYADKLSNDVALLANNNAVDFYVQLRNRRIAYYKNKVPGQVLKFVSSQNGLLDRVATFPQIITDFLTTATDTTKKKFWWSQ